MTADEMFLQEGYVKVIEDKESVTYYYDPTKEYLPIEKPSISIDKRDGFLGYTAEKDYNELQKQNKEYLTKIIQQNETIIQNQKKILERLTTD